MPPPSLRPRILLIEDDQGRIDIFERWLAGTEFVLVTVRSGGQALGMLAHGADGIAGLLLDHDLSDAMRTEADRGISTSHVMPVIVRTVPRHVPVLIHSHNTNKPVVMERMLTSAGLSVTRIRFNALTQEKFTAWLDEVRDNWEPPDPT